MNTKEFFDNLKWWYKEAKRSRKWSEYQWYDGRLRGMVEMGCYMELISTNTWELLITLLHNLEIEKIDRGFSQ